MQSLYLCSSKLREAQNDTQSTLCFRRQVKEVNECHYTLALSVSNDILIWDTGTLNVDRGGGDLPNNSRVALFLGSHPFSLFLSPFSLYEALCIAAYEKDINVKTLLI